MGSKISQLPSASTIAGTELVAVVQSGVTDSVAVSALTPGLATFTSSAKGVAPASGGGTTNFLRADGTWTTPAGGGAPAWLPILSGKAFGPALRPAMSDAGGSYPTWPVGSNTVVYAFPFMVGYAITATAIGVHRTGTFSGTGGAKFGIYDSTGTGGLPNTLLANVTCSTAMASGGTHSGTISQALSANTLYWVAAIFNGTAGTIYTGLPQFTLGEGATTGLTSYYIGVTCTGTYAGGLPGTFGSASAFSQSTNYTGTVTAEGPPSIWVGT